MSDSRQEEHIKYGPGAGAIKNMARSDSAFENGQVRDLYRDAENSLAGCPQSWVLGPLATYPLKGVHKLTPIIEPSVRSSHLGKENAKTTCSAPCFGVMWELWGQN